jgi:DNA invertase Pin-like site-specific DNA recombinase
MTSKSRKSSEPGNAPTKRSPPAEKPVAAKSTRQPMNEETGGKVRRGGVTRCAISTRKSSEEGLEQEFNSLDAHRVACEAYIKSQRHEGWTTLATMYDDGGISGGTMERPALTRMLADIEAKKVDTVVVYNVDRLTRSLSDFAKIVDIVDAQGVTFVSITQQFNTSTSMGRLPLNMLLSFAQFEREVTGARIRDKIAARSSTGTRAIPASMPRSSTRT